MHVTERNAQFDWTRKQPINIECANERFKSVNKFLLPKVIQLKSFNETATFTKTL